MICPDTSILVSFLRAEEGLVLSHYRQLAKANKIALPRVVVAEILMGASKRSYASLATGLRTFPWLLPSNEAWGVIERWVFKAIESGQRFQLTDLLIAATAAENNLPIWSLDHDFERMESLGFCRVYRPARTAAS